MSDRPARVGLDLRPDGQVLAVPLDYLPGAAFAAYRAACGASGGRYDPEARGTVLGPDLAPGLAQALRDAGFEAVVSPALADWLISRAGLARSEIEESQARLVAVQDRLQARGLALYPFQAVGTAWLMGQTSALLCDSMGVGKTIQAAAAINETPPRAIITCPASLKANWVRELARWRPDIMAISLSGRGSFTWPQPGQAVILNPELLPPIEAIGADGQNHRLKPFEDCPPGIDLIADECHGYKNSKAKRTKAFRALARAVRDSGGRTWGLTGTPILNRPEELHALLSAFDLLKQTFGDWPGFCRAWNSKPKYWGGREWGEPGPGVGRVLKRVMLRRTREEVLPDLPTKTRAVVPVDIDATTRSLCESARRAIEAAGLDLDGMIAAGKLSGAAFEEIAKTRAALATAKIPAMMDALDEYEESGEAVVVFSAHRAPIQALAHRPGWSCFTGETPLVDRAEMVERFQRGELRGLGATIQAGGMGITLTHAHHALFVDLDWTPAMNCQAEDRICRIGQDRGVMIRILAAPDTIDEQVAELLLAKQRLIDGSIERATARPAEMPRAVEPEQLEAAAANVGTVQPRAGRRGPNGQVESWAGQALLRLAAGRAFRGRDATFGESLAAQVQAKGELTDKQWLYAAKLCRNYEQEVGPCPA